MGYSGRRQAFMWSVGGGVLKSMFVPNELEMSLAI